MSASDLTLLPITRLSDLLHAHEITALELTEAYLARIEALDGVLKAYLTISADRAREEASRADRELLLGRSRGPMHGIPVALKDLFDTAGIRTTGGSRVLWERVPSQDATVTSKLSAAGAVLLGKLMMHEFAIGAPYLDDPILPAHNPWSTDRVPGGSSSGSGAAVAAGLCGGALGSDTGGSIRGPAAYCGIVGLKPTYGLVSRAGVLPLSWSLDHAGPMTRTVADTAVMLQAIAGYDPADAASAYVDIPDYSSVLSGSARGLRVGVPRRFVESAPGIEPDVLTAFNRSLEVLTQIGASVRDVEIDGINHAEAIQATIMFAEAVAYHEEWLQTKRELYSRGFMERVRPGMFHTATEYILAQRGRTMFCRAMSEALTQVDVIATPTMVRTAPTFKEEAETKSPVRGQFNRVFNATGQPSLSIPCGFDHHGMPIGLLLSGRAFEESTILRLGDAYERATEWHLRQPNIEPLAKSATDSLTEPAGHGV
jgi:aspartyl-tRNA(Asn)/glutamyl-tRNA(Gln) amidotransferase subunit A